MISYNASAAFADENKRLNTHCLPKNISIVESKSSFFAVCRFHSLPIHLEIQRCEREGKSQIRKGRREVPEQVQWSIL